MKKALAGFALMAAVAMAQQTRHEVVRNTTAAEDSKPNSPAVPDVYAIPSQFDRVVILRFKYQTDLLAGMEKMVKEQRIKNGVILSAAGSVRNYQVHSVSNRTLPSKNMFVEDPTGAADMIGMNGYVMNGQIHAHVTLATPEKAFGGHLEPGTNVFTFAIVTIGVLPDALDLSKLDDKNYR